MTNHWNKFDSKKLRHSICKSGWRPSMPRFMMIQVSDWVRKIESTLWLPRHKAGSTGCDATTTTHHIYAQAAIPSDWFHVPDPLSSSFPPKKIGVSKNNGTPKSSIKKYGFPLFSPSILGCFPPIFGNIQIQPSLILSNTHMPFQAANPWGNKSERRANHRLWRDNNPMTCDQHESSAMWPQTVL